MKTTPAYRCKTCQHYNTCPGTAEKRVADSLEPLRTRGSKQGVCNEHHYWTTENSLRCGGDEFQPKPQT